MKISAEGRIEWEARCPTCKALLDGATDPTGADNRPTPGDLSVCRYCGALLEFARDGMRLLTPGELAELEHKEPETYALLMRAAELVGKLAQRRGRN